MKLDVLEPRLILSFLFCSFSFHSLASVRGSPDCDGDCSIFCPLLRHRVLSFVTAGSHFSSTRVPRSESNFLSSHEENDTSWPKAAGDIYCKVQLRATCKAEAPYSMSVEAFFKGNREGAAVFSRRRKVAKKLATSSGWISQLDRVELRQFVRVSSPERALRKRDASLGVRAFRVL